MGWTRRPRRTVARKHRPDIESLEIRSLLSTTPASPGTPIPADSPSGGLGGNYDAMIGASSARSQYKVDGTGMTVAVVDAGINYNNAALGGGFGAGHKVVAGYDFTTNSPDPLATVAQHGTAVAGLIASSDATHPGIAPGADIAALRIFDNNDQGDFNRVADALQWVIDNHSTYNITVVNLSLSDGRNYTRNWFANDGGVGQRMTELVQKLDALNIPVVAATGNSYSGQEGQGFASIVPDTISVTASDASDHLVSNAQRLGSTLGDASATDIAAPGDGLTALVDASNFGSVSGTSFATPLVSGAVVLIQQVYSERFGHLPTVDQVDGWLKAGADTATDPSTGFSIGRLDIAKAIAAMPVPAGQVIIPPVTTPTDPAPPTDPSTPTTPTTPTTPSDPTAGVFNLWYNGHQVTNADLSNTSNSLPASLKQVLKSLKGWWGSNDATTTRVRVWTAAQSPSNAKAAGVIRPLATATPRHAPATATAQPMARAWHSFVARRASR